MRPPLARLVLLTVALAALPAHAQIAFRAASGSALSRCLRVAQEYCYRVMYDEDSFEAFRNARARCRLACIPSTIM